MYFKRLEVFGFKSFGEKAILNFDQGITAIVGPNGCGKSNVFDAIRWGLGEQSVKELRGSAMEDVIFNGTDKKPGLGFAEVNLTFANDARMLPIEKDEIVITRRLFRSGESEYLINKETSRLKDIQELLMGTGIGAEAYSLVQQGKVDLLVSARPEDRRLVFDEASGITKYKAKKREALNKLKDTENNLLRVNDIVQEVKRQIGSIERQANKARRYKGEFEKLKALEVQFAKHQIESFSSRKGEIQGSLESLRTQESELRTQSEELHTMLEHDSDLLNELESKINELRSEDIRLTNQIEVDTRQIGFNEERIDNLRTSQDRRNEQKTQLMERCRIQQEKLEEVKNDLRNIGTALEQNIQSLSERKTELKDIAESIQAAKDAIRQDEEKILQFSAQQVNIKNDLTEVMKELQGYLARKRRLDIEYTKVSSEKDEVDEKLHHICSEIENSLAKVNSLKAEQHAKNQVLNNLKERFSFLESTIAELEKKKLLLKSQKDFIEELRVQYQDIPDPIIEGKLLTKNAPDDHHTGILGKVKEVSLVAPGTYGNEESLYEVLCETKFIELDPQQIIAKMESVSREIEEQSRNKEEVGSEIHGLESVVQQLKSSIHDEEKSLSIFEAQKKNIEQESQKLLSELDLVETEIQEVKESLSSARRREEDLTQRMDESEQQLQWCQTNIKDKQEDITQKSQQRENATVAIAQLEAEIESVKDKEKSLNENLQMFHENLNNSLDEIGKIDEEVTGDQEKRQQITEEIQELKNKIASLAENKESMKDVLGDYSRQKDEVSQKLDSLRENITAVDRNIQEMKEKSHAEELKGQELAFNEKGIKDRLSQTYKIDFDQALASLEAEAQDAQASDEQTKPQPQMNADEMEVEIAKLKKRCDSFGSVNLVAIEEYEELKERYEFLNKQQEDLLTAKDSLHQTINKINRTTRQMFMETFTKVAENFRIYFRMLFGGGEAQLILIDPDNALESGIDIIARPPGKKLQNIGLLSGGEKTLTAIALIFGVFKVRPSPFCVLDEIDAALDESNVGRFGYLLKDFAKIAQFIVVTHNKKTIANANTMYGITMQEKGISKVVSVKLSEEEKDVKSEEMVAVAA